MTTRAFVTRAATAADAMALLRIWHAGWHDAHRGHVPDALCAARDESYFAARLATASLASCIVATLGEEAVVGFALVKGTQLDQLYIAAQHRRSGAGRLLLNAAERAIRAAGLEEAWLMLAAGNHAARHFYARHGWNDAGPRTVTLDGTNGSVSAVAHRYTKRLNYGGPGGRSTSDGGV